MATSDRPAMAQDTAVAYRASDSGLYISELDGSGEGWHGRHIDMGGGSSHGPALARLVDRYILVWKGLRDDPRMFMSSSVDGKTWTPQVRIVWDGGTSHGPALTVHRGLLYLVWKGIGADTNMYMSSSVDGRTWAPQQGTVPFSGTSEGPALAATADGLVLGWKGTGYPDGQLHFAHYRAGKWSDASWAPDNAHSDHAPALVGFAEGNGYCALWKGRSTDQNVYAAHSGTQGWGPLVTLRDVTTGASPAVAGDTADQIFLAWKGTDDSVRTGGPFVCSDSNL
ncbi:sialidase family protein [Nonomuraea lactucae]|uniref:sialidase family protein n=1 Tax=Nonomuraea lactucae TaxID=2249762 RepID=UPI000DE4CBF3|nr:sialidase family protein [Nonomuraea lactucae]